VRAVADAESEGLEYESLFIKGLIERGYAVALTDYQGLGTAGVHTYMNRVAQGRAVLDAVRAAQRLSGSGLSSLNPVGLVGYSQGGGASAAAAELAASYAPELKVKGAVAGAVPADLGAVATTWTAACMPSSPCMACAGWRRATASTCIPTSTRPVARLWTRSKGSA
jgi:pimeloyl-ACP methyl ester carboxylesterase